MVSNSVPGGLKEAPAQGLSSAQVEQQIQDKFNSEANTNVGVKTDGKSITLTGTVTTEGQHDLALRIAHSYAGDRNIVDKIKVRQQT